MVKIALGRELVNPIYHHRNLLFFRGKPVNLKKPLIFHQPTNGNLGHLWLVLRPGEMTWTVSGDVTGAAVPRLQMLQRFSAPMCPQNAKPSGPEGIDSSILIWLVVDLPFWKIWKSVGVTIPNIWKNKTCSKPPTCHEADSHRNYVIFFTSPWNLNLL